MLTMVTPAANDLVYLRGSEAESLATPSVVVPVALDGTSATRDAVFSVVTTDEGFRALEADWTALFERVGTGLQLFQTYQWCAAWMRHYMPRDGDGRQKLAIGTISRGGQLIGLLPFVTVRSRGVVTLSFMGDPVTQYGDVIIADVEDRLALLKRAFDVVVAETGADVADLRKVRADAAIAPLVKALGMQRTGGEVAPYCDLSKAGSFAALESRISSKLRKNWRRQQRRLEERGTLVYEVCTDECAAADARLALLMKQAWLIEKGRLSRAFKDERIQDFFEDVARAGPYVAGVEIDTLRTAGEMAAASISVTAKRRRGLHVVVYNMKFEKAGAGSMNLAKTLQRAFNEGVEIFDFLAPAHEYK
ncbi:MAG: hypothetical protein RL291_128, partial [Pseudomonadota bacterium]